MALNGSNLDGVLRKHFIKALTRDHIGQELEVIDRGTSIFIAPKDEDKRHVHRIILLPPRGYTANSPNLMNAHDEVEKATIEVLGAVREGKQGLSKLKDAILLAALPNNGISDQDTPYFTFNLDGEDNPDNLVLQTYSSGEAPFSVVKPDGYGFYHNLINLTDSWMVLELHKMVKELKDVDLLYHIKDLPKEASDALKTFYHNVLLYGDEVYKRRLDLVDAIAALPPEQSLPALGEMLYARETGRHEACAAFAMILKVGKEHPKQAIEFLNGTLEANNVPSYYAEQLIGKIHKKTGFDQSKLESDLKVG